jgi:hypothetical protein
MAKCRKSHILSYLNTLFTEYLNILHLTASTIRKLIYGHLQLKVNYNFVMYSSDIQGLTNTFGFPHI